MGKWFRDDDNHLLWQIQENGFSGLGGQLFRIPADRYIKAAQLLQVENDLTQAIHDLIWEKGYQFDILLPVYRLISAYYRFTTNPHGQLPLPDKDTQPVEEQIRSDWIDFYYSEVQKISENNAFARLMIRAVVYQEDEAGTNAVYELESELKEQYPMRVKREILPDFIIAEKNAEEEKQRFYHEKFWHPWQYH